MEHIVQIGIGIDDEAIKKAVAQNCEKVIISNIEKDVRKMMFKGTDWYGRPTNEPAPFLRDKIDAFFQENRDVILEMTADKLADKLSRTKKAREIVSEVVDKLNNI